MTLAWEQGCGACSRPATQVRCGTAPPLHALPLLLLLLLLTCRDCCPPTPQAARVWQPLQTCRCTCMEQAALRRTGPLPRVQLTLSLPVPTAHRARRSRPAAMAATRLLMVQASITLPLPETATGAGLQLATALQPLSMPQLAAALRRRMTRDKRLGPATAATSHLTATAQSAIPALTAAATASKTTARLSLSPRARVRGPQAATHATWGGTATSLGAEVPTAATSLRPPAGAACLQQLQENGQGGPSLTKARAPRPARAKVAAEAAARSIGCQAR